MLFDKKIDFMLVCEVVNANPNGDPLNGNMPRTDNNGYGEISDVCIKRKIRNRFHDMGEEIFVKSNERIDDGMNSLEARFENKFGKIEKGNDYYLDSCKNWLDVRTFGQVLTFQKLSTGIRGPVSITLAKSLDTVNITSMQITRSTNGQKSDSKGSDTMGTKHFVNYGVYLIKGSINSFFAEKSEYTLEDADKLKEALRTLFVNDVSSARPEGSMRVRKLYWIKHDSKIGNISTAMIHNMLDINRNSEMPTQYSDYSIELNKEMNADLKKLGVKVEEIEGL
jgi:CRISPR-associated protein Cas7/Csd2 subtype I-C